MAYVAPTARTTGTMITAAIWNQDVVDNVIAIYAGANALSSQAIGDMKYASSTTQWSRIAAVAAGSYFRSNGTGAAPIWSTLVLPNAATANRIVYAASSNTYGESAALTFNGTVLSVDAKAHITGTGTPAAGSGLELAGGAVPKILAYNRTGGALLPLEIETTYLNLTSAGLLSVSGFGSHLFTASGNGIQALRAINTSSAAEARSQIYGTAGTNSGGLQVFSDGWTTTGNEIQSSTILFASGVGGLSLAASHASGAIRFYSGGNTERGSFSTAGNFGLAHDLIVSSGNRVRFDGSASGDTYAYENTANRIGLVTGGTLGITFDAVGFWIPSGNKFWFDNGSDTYMYESSGNILDTFCGGTLVMRVQRSANPSSALTIESSANGAGNIPGNQITVRRNTSGSGAAGVYALEQRGGEMRYLWAHADFLRISTGSPPSEDATISHTSGVVVGDQTSWHEKKNVIGRSAINANEALRRVVATDIYDFTLKDDSYQALDGSPAVFTGMVGYSRDDWFLKNVGPQQEPCLNDYNVAGYHTLAIQALDARLSVVERRVH